MWLDGEIARNLACCMERSGFPVLNWTSLQKLSLCRPVLRGDWDTLHNLARAGPPNPDGCAELVVLRVLYLYG
jgi:hypothetical protein